MQVLSIRDDKYPRKKDMVQLMRLTGMETTDLVGVFIADMRYRMHGWINFMVCQLSNPTL